MNKLDILLEAYEGMMDRQREAHEIHDDELFHLLKDMKDKLWEEIEKEDKK